LKPRDWLAAVSKAEPSLRQAEYNGVKYLSGGDMSCYMPDERTLLAAPDARIRDLIQTGGRSARPAWADGWDKVSSGPVVAMVNVDVVGRVLDAQLAGHADSLISAVAPIWQNSRVVVLNLSLDKNLALHAIAESPNPEAGKKVVKILQAFTTLAENYLDAFSRSVEQGNGPDKAAAAEIVGIAKDVLGHVEITQQGNLVDLRMQTEKVGPNTISGLVWPAVRKMQESASRMQSQK
jgi:hypothetical protein